MYKLDCERPGRGRGSSSSLGEFNARAREVELEHEVKRLKQVGPGSPCLTGSDAQVPTGWVSGEGAEICTTTFPHMLLSAPFDNLVAKAAHPHRTAQARRLVSRLHLMEIPGSLLGIHKKK